MSANDLVVVSAGLLAALALSACPAMAEDSNSGTDGHGAFATGQYRNLFAENGHSQPEIQNKINSAFALLFQGDPATQAVYYSAGENSNGPLAYECSFLYFDFSRAGV